MKNRKKKVIKSAAAVTMIAATMSLTSCEFMAAFADGMAQGMASYNYYNPYGYGSADNYYYTPNYNNFQTTPTTSNPDLAYQQIIEQTIQQTNQQMAQQQALLQQFINQGIKEANQQMAQQQALLPQFIYQPAPYTMAPDFEAGFNSSGNEYHGSLSQDQYENMYRKWERIAEGCINNGISGGSSPTAACLQNKQTLLDAQKQMKRIRSEAAQNGVYIQQSRWETATGGY